MKTSCAIVILALSTFWGAASFAQNKTLKNIRGSQASLLKLMDDEYAEAAYKSIQYKYLNTKTDSSLRSFFEETPVLTTTFQKLQEAQEQLIKDFIIQAETGMYRLREDSPEKMQVIDRMVVETSTDLGFTEEAILNRRIYITYGNINAFTISGSDKVIVVVINSGLVDKLDEKEIRSVIGHELGHIKSKHTAISILTQVLLNISATYLSQGSVGLLSLRAQANEILMAKTCEHHEHQNIFASSNLNNFSSSDQEFNQIFAELLRMPAGELLEASYKLMGFIHSSADTLNIPAGSKQYLQNIMDLMVKQSQNPAGEVRIDVKDFAGHAEVVMNALSRMKETSADHYAGSIMPNEIVASAFAKLMGASFSRENRKIMFKHIREQVREFYKNYSPEERLLGMGTSHPALALRIDGILSIDKFPNVAIANPFQRLIMVRDELKSQRLEVLAGINEIKSIAKNPQQKLSKEELDGLKKQIAEQVKIFEAHIQGIDAATAKAEDEILSLILNFNTKIRNPRLENYIQLVSYKRELMLFQIDNITELLPTIKDEQAVLSLKQIQEILRQHLQQPDKFTEKIIKGLSAQTTAESKKYIDLLKELKKVNSLEAGEGLRAKITNFNKNTSLPPSANPKKCEELLMATRLQ